MGLFGCGPAVVALTTGLPLPIISAAIVGGGHDPEAIRPSELASAYANLGWRMVDQALLGANGGGRLRARPSASRQDRDRTRPPGSSRPTIQPSKRNMRAISKACARRVCRRANRKRIETAKGSVKATS
jgi:hypothetical protein